MTKAEILRACEKHVKFFEERTKGCGFEAKGIFNSEMLMFVSIARELGIRDIIESGRARGQSTAVICRCFSDAGKIHSVEYSRYTRDSLIARRRLQGCANLEMHFGDSTQLIPRLIDEECCILIDGPKGDTALELAASLLENPLVRAVFLHDFHKDAPERAVIPRLFARTFFSDDEEFVDRFQYLDEPCWKEQARQMDWGPYKRGPRQMKSYSATLAAVFSGEGAVNREACAEYFRAGRAPRPRGGRAAIAKAAFRKLRTLTARPLWYMLYHIQTLRLKARDSSSG